MTADSPSARVSTAGPAGDDVRSDLHVSFEDAATLEVQLVSRVELYYGEAIRAQAKDVLEVLGITKGRLTIHDGGALPFVIAARIEAAVKRAGLAAGRSAVPDPRPLPPESQRDRLRRSRLYLPGSEPKYMISAGLHESDAIILDLEDSVHPDHKDAARLLVRNALASLDFAAAERMVRINQWPLGLDDLAVVVPQHPDLILIPKVESAEEVKEVDRQITALLGDDSRNLWLMPILESALGIERAFEIAACSSRTVALTIGLEDYTADLGVPKTGDGEESLYARMRVVNAARAAGLQAIDSVFGNVDDEMGLLKWGERSRRMGFEGMGCVHPRQITPIHKAFAPSTAEIERAQAIVAAFETATAEGRGVVSLGSKMIDPPVVERALKLVERARAMKLLPAAAQP